MKYLRKILFFGSLIFITILIILHILANLKGKAIVTRKLEETFHRKVTIGRLTTSLFSSLRIKHISIEGIGKADEVIVGGGVFDIFKKTFNISLLKIRKPYAEFSFSSAAIQNPVDASAQSLVPAPAVSPAPLELVPENKVFKHVRIDRIVILGGHVQITDTLADGKTKVFHIKDIEAKIDNINFTKRGFRVISFATTARVPWEQTEYEGKISAHGWVDLFKKDINAKLVIENIDGVSLHPYYEKWVDLEKARIEKARINFSSDIIGSNNDVVADCHAELVDIVRSPRLEGEDAEKAEKIADAVIDIFRSLNEGKITLDFKIKTKMDYPQFGFEDIRQAVEREVNRGRPRFGVNVEQIAALPANLLRGTVKGFAGLFKAVIEGIAATGKEFGEAVGGAVQKKPDPAQQN